ncbi:MAG: hypothetical protein EBR90_03735, partial [Actinobacteria bacterium]|nr:hypothetical protein [Actinomycetota bacterium]
MKLVTTKYSRFCGSTSALHLGEWCLEEHPAEGDNLIFLPKRIVSVREKIQTASECLQIAKSIFPDVVQNLNNYHGISKSHSYWKIILGLWLQNFVDVVFQRDALIRRALSEFPIYSADGIEINHPMLVADCTQDYLPQLVSQEWNSALFSEILNFRGVRVSSVGTPLARWKTSHRGSSKFIECSFLNK